MQREEGDQGQSQLFSDQTLKADLGRAGGPKWEGKLGSTIDLRENLSSVLAPAWGIRAKSRAETEKLKSELSVGSSLQFRPGLSSLLSLSSLLLSSLPRSLPLSCSSRVHLCRERGLRCSSPPGASPFGQHPPWVHTLFPRTLSPFSHPFPHPSFSPCLEGPGSAFLPSRVPFRDQNVSGPVKGTGCPSKDSCPLFSLISSVTLALGMNQGRIKGCLLPGQRGISLWAEVARKAGSEASPTQRPQVDQSR